MAAEVQEPLNKVDSAISGLSSSPTDDKKMSHRRTSSTNTGVYSLADLEKERKEIKISKETQTLNWKLNTSPSTVDDKDALKKLICEPPVKKVDLQFPLGLEVTARNLKGVTIKDALDAIYKQFKKKADDELDEPYLKGFEWDKEECWTRFKVHQKKEGGAPPSKKSKKKAAEEE